MNVAVFVITSVVLGTLFIVGVVSLMVYIPQKSARERQEERKRNLKIEYDNLITEKEKILEEKFKNNEYSIGNYMAIFDNKLYMFEHLFDLDFYCKYDREIPSIDKILKVVDIDDIKYFNLTGEKTERQYISGGGGGGSSIKGAVVGGLVAGEVGAIIGSRKKVDEVKTEYKKVDSRRTMITLNNGIVLDESPSLYELLLSYIPEKDYENYIYNLKNKGKKTK